MEKPIIKCELCDFEMSMRINPSHLKFKHNITLQEYKIMFPNADTGKYLVDAFVCKICNMHLDGYTHKIKAHLENTHQLTVDQYNKIYNIKYCLCGCGNIAEYSNIRHKFNDYAPDHYHGWNLGLTKETDNRLAKTFSKKFLWTQISGSRQDELRRQQSETLKQKFKNGEIDLVARSEKYKQTINERYGTDNYFSTNEFKEYIINYNLEKYGVPNPMQNPEFFDRNRSFRIAYKEIERSGILFTVQGYEDIALDYLLEKYAPTDIIFKKKEMPKFKYLNPETKKMSTYFPDFYIKSKNLIIEVKSYYTLKIEKFLTEKRQSVNDCGINYEIWIINNRKEKKLTIIK